MSEWNWLDRVIAKIRYKTIKKYIPTNGVVADIGCGQDGAFLKYCQPFIARGYGFDYKIKNTKNNNLQFKNNRHSERLELRDECCDTVFMIAVLEHLEQPKKILEEAFRILKTDGMLVITTPTKAARIILELMAFKLHIINEEEVREHKHYYNKKEIFKLFHKCGFSDYQYKKFFFRYE